MPAIVPEQALANVPRQDADCVGLIGVNVYGEIHVYARRLLEAHGPRAIAEAAQNAIDLEAKGEVELAKDWRHVEDAMKLMRGPHQS
jgi:hypothetical protein